MLLTVIKSFYLTQRFGGTDLRCRVVGTRLLATDHSPYFYKWNPADGDFLLDPNDQASRMVNGNVVTPAVLYITYPLAVLPYSVVRPLWTVLHFIAGLALLILLLRKQAPSRTLITSVIIINGLICSNTWLTAIERGQMYIFYALGFALMYCIYISKLKYNEWISGFIGGLFILFRPFVAIIGVGFLLQWKTKWMAGCTIGLITGICLFVLPNPSLWKDYFKAMQEYTNESSFRGHIDTSRIDPVKPAVIEGMTTLTQYKNLEAGGLAAVYGYLSDFGIHIDNNQSYLLYAIVIVLLSVFFFRLKNKGADPETLFLFAFLLYILAEMFTVAPRAKYNVIQWIFPLTIICRQIRPSTTIFIGLIAGLLLLHSFPFLFPYQGEMAELSFIAVTFYCIFFPDSFKKAQYGVSRI